MIGHARSCRGWGRRWRHDMLCVMGMRMRSVLVVVWVMMQAPSASRDGERGRGHPAQSCGARRRMHGRRMGENDLGRKCCHLYPAQALAESRPDSRRRSRISGIAACNLA